MRRKMFATIAGVVVACAVALAGCNGDETPPSAGPTSTGLLHGLVTRSVTQPEWLAWS